MKKERVKPKENKEMEVGTLEGNLKVTSKVHWNEYIPCLFLEGYGDKLIVFFHANGEDISSAY